jgi:hypothetical protein
MAVSNIAGAGDNIVSTSSLYGGVRDLFALYYAFSHTDSHPARHTTNSKVGTHPGCDGTRILSSPRVQCSSRNLESGSSLSHQTNPRHSRRPLMRIPRLFSWRASEIPSITSVRSARSRRYEQPRFMISRLSDRVVLQVAHEHKIPLIVDNTFGMGGTRYFLSQHWQALMRIRLSDPPN